LPNSSATARRRLGDKKKHSDKNCCLDSALKNQHVQSSGRHQRNNIYHSGATVIYVAQQLGDSYDVT